MLTSELDDAIAALHALGTDDAKDYAAQLSVAMIVFEHSNQRDKSP